MSNSCVIWTILFRVVTTWVIFHSTYMVQFTHLLHNIYINKNEYQSVCLKPPFSRTAEPISTKLGTYFRCKHRIRSLSEKNTQNTFWQKTNARTRFGYLWWPTTRSGNFFHKKYTERIVGFFDTFTVCQNTLWAIWNRKKPTTRSRNHFKYAKCPQRVLHISCHTNNTPTTHQHTDNTPITHQQPTKIPITRQ